MSATSRFARPGLRMPTVTPPSSARTSNLCGTLRRGNCRTLAARLSGAKISPPCTRFASAESGEEWWLDSGMTKRIESASGRFRTSREVRLASGMRSGADLGPPIRIHAFTPWGRPWVRQINPTGKISLNASGKSLLQISPSHPARGAYRDRHETRDGMWWTRRHRARDGMAGRASRPVSGHRTR
jgi:hypothetical protein